MFQVYLQLAGRQPSKPLKWSSVRPSIRLTVSLLSVTTCNRRMESRRKFKFSILSLLIPHGVRKSQRHFYSQRPKVTRSSSQQR